MGAFKRLHGFKADLKKLLNKRGLCGLIFLLFHNTEGKNVLRDAENTNKISTFLMFLTFWQ